MNALFRSLKTVSSISLSTVLIGLIGDKQGYSYSFLTVLDRYKYSRYTRDTYTQEVAEHL
jgi:hypothetical protein